jgi:hypothetical protein
MLPSKNKPIIYEFRSAASSNQNLNGLEQKVEVAPTVSHSIPEQGIDDLQLGNVAGSEQIPPANGIHSSKNHISIIRRMGQKLLAWGREFFRTIRVFLHQLTSRFARR